MGELDGGTSGTEPEPAAMFGRCPGCASRLEVRASLVGRTVVGYRLWCADCGPAGPMPESGPVADAWRQSLIDSQVRAARYREPLLGDRRAWPLLHHDPDLAEYAQRLASLRDSAAGPHVTLRFDGAGWAAVGVAHRGSDAQEWMASEDRDIHRP